MRVGIVSQYVVMTVDRGGIFMKAMYDVYQVANWFLKQESLSPKKLQQLVYYAYSWTLVLLNESENSLTNKLFDERIEAWAHGPVIPELYDKYKCYGWEDIPQEEINENVHFCDDVQEILDQILTVYGGFSANQLESITHQESPWIKARIGLLPGESGNVQIDDEEIFNCYSKRLS